jgi:hypothetical protein
VQLSKKPARVLVEIIPLKQFAGRLKFAKILKRIYTTFCLNFFRYGINTAEIKFLSNSSTQSRRVHHSGFQGKLFNIKNRKKYFPIGYADNL